MSHPPGPRPPETVRVVVDDGPELEERVREAARRARATGRSVELVEAAVGEHDHEARARMIRHMDTALWAARHAAPGVCVRVGGPIELPRPREAP
jgi:hypothetical protein